MAFRIYHSTQPIAGKAPRASANFLRVASISSICKRTRGLPWRPVISINRQPHPHAAPSPLSKSRSPIKKPMLPFKTSSTSSPPDRNLRNKSSDMRG